MLRKALPAVLAGACLFGVSQIADAATILSYTGDAGGALEGRGDGPYTIGSLIQVNVAGLTLTQLGVMDVIAGAGSTGTVGAAGNGFASSPITVAIWDSAGALLQQVAVASTDNYIGGYRYHDLTTPINLVSGQQYRIGAFVGSGKEFFLDGFGGIANPDRDVVAATNSTDISLIKAGFASGFGNPTGDPGSLLNRWGAANAIVIPEPTVAACLIGATGLSVLLRRRRS